mgnify:FL=1
MNDERNLGEKTDDSGQQPRYEHYQFHEEQRTVLKPSGPSGHRRNQNSFQKKAGATIALAVIFGLVAAVVFQAANFAADRFLNTGKSSVQIKTTDSVDLQETASDDSTADKVLSDSENGTVAAVAQASMPSVVAITTVSVQEIPSFFGYSSHQYKSASTGSGIIVGDNDDELLIATNNHVVDGATTLSVCFIGDDVANAETETVNAGDNGDLNVEDAVSAKIKGTDADNDLAVVAVKKSDIPEDTLNQIKIAQIGSSDDLAVGQQVVAIGNALGYGQSVTSGWISALNRTISTDDGTNSTGLIQTDAAINPGNSGGALVNAKGELVGINSVLSSPTGAYAGYGFAIPTSIMTKVIADLKQYGTVQRALLGIRGGSIGSSLMDDRQPIDKSGKTLADKAKELGVVEGVWVSEIVENGSAAGADIKVDDVIIGVDNKKVSNMADLQEALAKHRPGDKVKVKLMRDKKEKTVEVTLKNEQGTTKIVKDAGMEILGAAFKELPDDVKKQLNLGYGLQVTGVSSGKMSDAGVRKGFIILKANDQPMRKVSDLEEVMKAAVKSPNQVLFLTGVFPSGKRGYFAVDLTQE